MRMPVESFTSPNRGASDGVAARPNASVARSIEDMRGTPFEMGELVPHPLKRNCPPDSLTRSTRCLQPRELDPHRIRGRPNRGLGVMAQSKVVLIRSDSPFPVAQFRRESPLLAQAGGEERLPSDEVVPVPQ